MWPSPILCQNIENSKWKSSSVPGALKNLVSHVTVAREGTQVQVVLKCTNKYWDETCSLLDVYHVGTETYVCEVQMWQASMPLFQDMLDTSAQPLWKRCLDVAVNVNGLSLKNLAIHSYIIMSSSGGKKHGGRSACKSMFYRLINNCQWTWQMANIVVFFTHYCWTRRSKHDNVNWKHICDENQNEGIALHRATWLCLSNTLADWTTGLRVFCVGNGGFLLRWVGWGVFCDGRCFGRVKGTL